MSLIAGVRRIVLVGALAGLVAGAFVTAAQWVGVVPLILQAETYEQAAATGAEAAHAEHDPWVPTDGAERVLYTLLANLLTGVGFGLLLAAALSLKGEGDWRRGLYWGVAGFVTFSLAPSLGLPPELPGAEAAPLVERQAWWIFAAFATGGGLALLLLLRRAWAAALGVGLLVLPHVLGAPQSEAHGGLAPAELARQFVVAVTVTNLLFWAVLGGAAGFFYRRIAS